MTTTQKKSDKNQKITSEKPVSFYPLTFKEALVALLKVKPPPKNGKKQETNKSGN